MAILAIALILISTFCVVCNTSNIDSKTQVKSSDKNTNETKNFSIDSEFNSENEELSTTELNTENIVSTESCTEDINGFKAKSELISEEDEETIVSLCNFMCHKFAKIYNAKINDSEGEEDFSLFVQYENLNGYLIAELKECTFESISDSENALFSVDEISLDGEVALVNGVYNDKEGAYGSFTFIVSNTEGTFYVNDMIYKAMGSADYVCRPDFIENPYPDYWLDQNNYDSVMGVLLS